MRKRFKLTLVNKPCPQCNSNKIDDKYNKWHARCLDCGYSNSKVVWSR